MANIESREWRQQYLMKNNIAMEHPRASTTDDVECFFSVLCDTVGKDFTLKEVKFCITLPFLNVVFQVLFGWRKVTYERMDPDLPFYYHALILKMVVAGGSGSSPLLASLSDSMSASSSHFQFQITNTCVPSKTDILLCPQTC